MQPEAGIAPIVQAIKQARTAVSHLHLPDGPAGGGEGVGGGGAARRQRLARSSPTPIAAGEAALRKLEQRLLAAGATVSRTGDDLARYHAKYMVVDNVLHVLGFNLTKLDILKSRSFAVSTKDRRSVQEALKLFAADSSRQPYEPSRSNLVVSPETSRDAARAVHPRGEATAEHLRRQGPGPGDGQAAERAGRRAGVDVRVIGTLKGGSDAIAVRKLGMRLHVRAIVRDGTRAFVGSQSLRTLELSGRREVGLIITNPTVAKKIQQVFDADWEDASPKQIKAEGADVKGDEQGQDEKQGKKDKDQNNGKDEKKATTTRRTRTTRSRTRTR